MYTEVWNDWTTANNAVVTVVALSAAVSMVGTTMVQAQEHPEHLTTDEKEHAEHPEEGIKVDIETIAEAITSYVETDSKLKGGYFFVYDPTSKTPLQLTLTKVHKERLSRVGENLFFACSDFSAASGKEFDLDFFMREDEGRLVVTEVMIHKEDGNPRYTWYQKGDVWKRKKG